MFLWLHTQSATNMGFIIWMYRCYIVYMLNIVNDELTPLLMLLLCWFGVYRFGMGVGFCDVLLAFVGYIEK